MILPSRVHSVPSVVFNVYTPALARRTQRAVEEKQKFVRPNRQRFTGRRVSRVVPPRGATGERQNLVVPVDVIDIQHQRARGILFAIDKYPVGQHGCRIDADFSRTPAVTGWRVGDTGSGLRAHTAVEFNLHAVIVGVCAVVELIDRVRVGGASSIVAFHPTSVTPTSPSPPRFSTSIRAIAVSPPVTARLAGIKSRNRERRWCRKPALPPRCRDPARPWARPRPASSFLDRRGQYRCVDIRRIQFELVAGSPATVKTAQFRMHHYRQVRASAAYPAAVGW